MTDRVAGERFSHIYIDRGEPGKDSKRARYRLSKLAERECSSLRHIKYGNSTNHANAVQNLIERELGIAFKTRAKNGRAYPIWEWFFERIELTDLLDTITLIANYFNARYKHDAKGFIDEVRRIFQEENLAYEIDDSGGVRPMVDSAFHAARQSAIESLNRPRYEASAVMVEKVDRHMLESPPNYIMAIRSVFGACENLFKLMYGVPRLDAGAAKTEISKDHELLYAAHPVLLRASMKSLEGFRDWIDSAHFFRHEQGSETPSQPAEEQAILMISQGFAFVRWLASIDANKSNGSGTH